MKPFIAPYSLDECKVRLANLGSSRMFGFMQIKVKFIPAGGGDYRYVLWKTMRGNFGEDTTLAEVSGKLMFRNSKTTDVSGVSRMGRFYRVLFVFYGVIFIFAVVSFLTSQKFSYLFFAGLLIGFAGFGWLLTFYWRNQLEGMAEHALMLQKL